MVVHVLSTVSFWGLLEAELSRGHQTQAQPLCKADGQPVSLNAARPGNAELSGASKNEESRIEKSGNKQPFYI